MDDDTQQLPAAVQTPPPAPSKTPRWGLFIVAVIIVSAVTSAAVGGVVGYLAASTQDPIVVTTSSDAPADIVRILDGDTVVVQEESAVIDVVERVSPAVVSIIVSQEVSSSGGPFDDPRFRQFFGLPSGESELQQVGGGTGFLISEDGVILTNKHVVAEDNAQYEVITNEGESFEATVLARDPTNDIAVIKIDIENAPTVELGDSSALQVGQRVVAIGNALGQFGNTVSTGVISGISRSITAGSARGGGTDELANVIQTDSAINPGNSGGPLLDISGKVIGINTAIAQNAQNIGFALPINDAKADVASVLETGKIVRPVVGIRFIPISSVASLQAELNRDSGAFIPVGTANEPTVVPDGPADKAGLRERDLIVKIDGEPVDADHTLPNLLLEHPPESRVTLTVLRGGKEIEVEITLGSAEF